MTAPYWDWEVLVAPRPVISHAAECPSWGSNSLPQRISWGVRTAKHALSGKLTSNIPTMSPCSCADMNCLGNSKRFRKKKLFERNGLFLAGSPHGATIQGVHLAKSLHNIPLETVDPAHYQKRFPGYRIPDEFEVVYEPAAGYLHVEETVRTHLEEAGKAGATLAFDTRVRKWKKQGDEFLVTTDNAEFTAKKLIVTAGSWTREILESLEVPLQVRRKILCWHPVRSNVYDVGRGASCFFVEMPYGEFYGFPSIDRQTVKLAEHSGGNNIGSPRELIRTELDGDGDSVRRFIRECMPELEDRAVAQAVCMYTMSPDQHFIVDELPGVSGLYLGAGFSGHGFKFTSVMGEVLADFAESGTTGMPVEFLRLGRFRTE